MLTSLGIDIIEIDRVRQAIQRRPRLAPRLFTPRERAYCDQRSDSAPHYAARFAAKEATAKVLGRPLRWHDVEIVSLPSGQPTLALSGEAAALARVADGWRLLVSLSHSREHAVACVALISPQAAEGAGDNLLPPGVWT